MTVTFAEHEAKTKLTLRHSILESVEEREGTQQGWIEMLDRHRAVFPDYQSRNLPRRSLDEESAQAALGRGARRSRSGGGDVLPRPRGGKYRPGLL